MSEDNSSLILHNETIESTFFKDEFPLYPLEFAKNKLLVTCHPSHILIIVDWIVTKCILDPNTTNISKSYVFLLPGFDQIKFPFIAVCG